MCMAFVAVDELRGAGCRQRAAGPGSGCAWPRQRSLLWRGCLCGLVCWWGRLFFAARRNPATAAPTAGRRNQEAGAREPGWDASRGGGQANPTSTSNLRGNHARATIVAEAMHIPIPALPPAASSRPPGALSAATTATNDPTLPGAWIRGVGRRRAAGGGRWRVAGWVAWVRRYDLVSGRRDGRLGPAL